MIGGSRMSIITMKTAYFEDENRNLADEVKKRLDIYLKRFTRHEVKMEIKEKLKNILQS